MGGLKKRGQESRDGVSNVCILTTSTTCDRKADDAGIWTAYPSQPLLLRALRPVSSTGLKGINGCKGIQVVFDSTLRFDLKDPRPIANRSC